MSPSPKFDVEQALDEVVAEIARGAWPLRLDQRTETGLEDLYRDDFQKRCDEGADWNAEKAEVLPLARLVGALATFGTTIGDPSGSLATGEVDEQTAYLSARVVATVHCPAEAPGGPIKILRKWCRNVGSGSSPAPVALGPRLAEAFERLREAAGRSRE